MVGDQRGRVGFGHGKAREVPEAIRKATDAAKRNMVRIPLKDGRTLSSRKPMAGMARAKSDRASRLVQGTGIIAGGPMRAVFESLGVGDVVAKSLGTSNPVQHGAQRDLRCAEASAIAAPDRRSAVARRLPRSCSGAKVRAKTRRTLPPQEHKRWRPTSQGKKTA